MSIAIETPGLHPATELCLAAIQQLHGQYPFRNILDMGCGNGILSVAAAGLWNAPVLAVDISEKAVEDTRRNAREHGLEKLITALRSDGFSAEEISARAPYDLILFNLLAEHVVQMAGEVKSHLTPSGIAVTGGILTWKAAETKAAYEILGFEMLEEIINSPWHLFILQRQAHS